MRDFVIALIAAVLIAYVSSVPLGREINAGVGCNDTQDLEIFKKTNATFHASLESCASKCLGAVTCTTNCIVTNVGLTQDCATCFANDAHCAELECAKYCVAAPNSADCLNCIQTNCFPALVTCSMITNTSVFPK